LLGGEPGQVTPRQAKGNDVSFFEDDLFVEIAALEADGASYGYRF